MTCINCVVCVYAMTCINCVVCVCAMTCINCVVCVCAMTCINCVVCVCAMTCINCVVCVCVCNDLYHVCVCLQLVVGVYVLKLTMKNQLGMVSAEGTVEITVHPAVRVNTPPIPVIKPTQHYSVRPCQL